MLLLLLLLPLPPAAASRPSRASHAQQQLRCLLRVLLDKTDILTYGYLDGGMVVVDESLAGRKKGQRQRRR